MLRKSVVLKLILGLGLLFGVAGSANAQTLLPNGQQQFVDSNGQPLAGGSVYFYVPGTTSAKYTYQNPGLTTANTNPVVLNAAGRAVVWGSGLYREVVYDSAGNLVWDQLTTGQGALPVARKITGSTTIASCSSFFPIVASAPVTLVFPTVPNTGDTCTIADAGNTAGTYPITANFGTNTTNQGATTDVISANGGNRTYVWLGDPAVWQVLDESMPQSSVSGYYAVDTGAVNAMVITLTPAPANQAALIGIPITIQVANTNTINVPTLNVNGFGAHNVSTYGITCPGCGGTANIVGIGTFAAFRFITVTWDGFEYQFNQPSITATQAQVIAGTDGISPITSLALALAQPHSFSSSSGYQVLANGLTMQWGTYVPATGDQDVFSFPVSFSTHGVSIVANSFNSAAYPSFVTISFNNNGQGITSTWKWNGTTMVNVAGITIHWFAIGY